MPNGGDGLLCLHDVSVNWFKRSKFATKQHRILGCPIWKTSWFRNVICEYYRIRCGIRGCKLMRLQPFYSACTRQTVLTSWPRASRRVSENKKNPRSSRCWGYYCERIDFELTCWQSFYCETRIRSTRGGYGREYKTGTVGINLLAQFTGPLTGVRRRTSYKGSSAWFKPQVRPQCSWGTYTTVENYGHRQKWSKSVFR